jgi:sec-independent protein translocase protein TatC
MTNFFKKLGRAIIFPFVLIFNIIAFPFRAIYRAYRFLNEDPKEDRPVTETFSSFVTDADVRQSFWDHLEALRGHLLRVVIAMVLGVGVSFYFTIQLMGYLSIPVGGLENLQAIQVTEEISVYMRVALSSGFAIMFPYIAFELWLFAAPGLKSRERKFSLIGIPLATILFLCGAAFTFFILLPTALQFLGGFTNIKQNWTAGEYFGFIMSLMFWLGIFFEFPLVVYFLSSIGFLKPNLLAQQWRLAIVIIAIIAAAITPTIDAATMALVMFPMSVLYFLSIGLSYIAYAGRTKRESAKE